MSRPTTATRITAQSETITAYRTIAVAVSDAAPVQVKNTNIRLDPHTATVMFQRCGNNPWTWHGGTIEGPRIAHDNQGRIEYEVLMASATRMPQWYRVLRDQLMSELRRHPVGAADGRIALDDIRAINKRCASDV